MIRALALADRDGLDQRDWISCVIPVPRIYLLFRAYTVSIVAGVFFIASRYIIGFAAPVSRRWPAQRPAAVIGFIAALAYASLAGFPISTQRALIMLAVIMLAL